MRTLLLTSALARIVGVTFALFLVLCLTGCDQIQGLVDGGADAEVKSDTPAATAPAAATAQPAAKPGQPTAPADPVQILAAFRVIPPRDVTDAALQKVADVPAAAAEIKDLDMTGSSVGTVAITLLAKFPNLQSVKLSGVQALPGSFAGFSPQSTFSEIDLDNSTLASSRSHRSGL